MKYFSDSELIVFTIATGVAVWVASSALRGLARLFDQAVPDLARRLARFATRMIPEDDRNLYNFESDIHEALSTRHRYSAFGAALASLLMVAPRAAVREKQSARLANSAGLAIGRTIVRVITWTVRPVVVIAASAAAGVQLLPLAFQALSPNWSAMIGGIVGALSHFFTPRSDHTPQQRKAVRDDP
jgi:hypothetical protein